MSDLTEIRCFLRVAELESFTAAARALGVSQPTVSKAVAALEARLGAPLVRRTTRSLRLTDDGADYYTTCRRLLSELEEADARVGRGREAPRGLLRISCPRELGQRWLTGAVLDFLAEFADVQVDLAYEDRRVDLAAEGFDLAVRLGALDDSALVAQRLGSFPRLLAASPAYLERAGPLRRAEDLRAHACIINTALQTPRRWILRDVAGREQRINVSGRVATSSHQAALEAALAGHGVIQGPHWLLGEALDAGGLVPVLSDHRVPGMEVHALHAGGSFVPLKVRRFVERLRERWRADGVLE